MSAFAFVARLFESLRHPKETHGRDRTAEADPRDPGAGTSGAAGAVALATGGAIGPRAGVITVPISIDTTAFQAAITRMQASHMASSFGWIGSDLSHLETVQGGLPILAHRKAYLMPGRDEPFASLHHSYSFGVDAEATCERHAITVAHQTFRMMGATHDAPVPNCTCGFYAVPSDVEPWTCGSDMVTLLVELSGRVIEHEKGYRAQRQRVVECQLPPCILCRARAEFVFVDFVDAAGRLEGVTCSRHAFYAEGRGCGPIPVAKVAAGLPVPVTFLGSA